ncbi:hypothetical protein [Parasphingorhabdus sp.]|uniref:hypothetical protein n=1 Tax=Parasphingorhabdus sp. TaxID=2709688 RepID=UPI003BAE66AD
MRILYSQLLFIAVAMPSAVSAQSEAPAPSEELYEDVGRGVGMTWSFQSQRGKPALEFGVKETEHRLDRLWEFSCANFKNGTVSNTLFANPPELREGDQFGFSIRIDNGKSYGLIGRMDPIQIQGSNTNFPHFDIGRSHDLWKALRLGNRAFINLNGNKFSIHLEGSGTAIGKFLNVCKKNAG